MQHFGFSLWLTECSLIISASCQRFVPEKSRRDSEAAQSNSPTRRLHSWLYQSKPGAGRAESTDRLDFKNWQCFKCRRQEKFNCEAKKWDKLPAERCFLWPGPILVVLAVYGPHEGKCACCGAAPPHQSTISTVSTISTNAAWTDNILCVFILLLFGLRLHEAVTNTVSPVVVLIRSNLEPDGQRNIHSAVNFVPVWSQKSTLSCFTILT